MASETPSRNGTTLRTGAGLKAWRDAHRLSQRKLGTLMDVSWMTVYRWENGLHPISRTVEMALLWLDHELAQQPELLDGPIETTLSATDELILELCRERGDDVETSPTAALIVFRAAHDNDQDLEAAVGGNVHAMIRVRKAAGLRAFR